MYNGKVVIVTGGSNGIGKEIALGYENLGAKVIAFDVVEGDFKNTNIDFMKVDLKNSSEIENAFEIIKEKYGAIHILINNGALSRFNKSIFEITSEEFKEVIDVNLTGSFVCAKEFIKGNKGESYGRIVNIASTRWNQNQAGWEAYGASKGGLVSLTNTLAISLGETPITVNAISPGWIECNDYEGLREIDHSQHPSTRVGKPRDILNACLFLTNKENDFVNALNLVVDGGMTKKMIYMDKEWK